MATKQWSLDPSHSEVQFKVKHLMISTVSGEFKEFDVTLTTEDNDFTKAKATFSAPLSAITTKNEQRDNHLRSADFFDAENHPHVTFESTSISKKDDEEYELKGNLTIRGNSRPVILKVENSGVMTDPWGNTRTGFEISGKISRKDFGLTYNAALETGGVVVGDDVRLFANVELVQQQ
ncbi:MAG TPA: YceI family protein [Edaphocola sp.]|nr:YceI family protein [Edaphocola sp.]